ncbi:MAG TPA: hypothetical protein VE817_01090 [Candidatus Acidoferrum sp.]|nr:hypothetical protein [Candidatus Acidoferrum sp.]
MTAAQRARLVVALGLLNLILATVALTAGFVAPARPDHDIAVTGATPAPSPSLAIEGSPGANPTPAESAGSGSEPPPASVGPSIEPSIAPSPASSGEPPASTAPTEGPIVAVAPTPTPGTTNPSPSPAVSTPRPTHQPTPQPTAHPTPRPTAKPTPRPTARPTATPEPVTGKVSKPRPPCPGDGSGPPGHNKVEPPPGRPCSAKGKGSGGTGMVVVLPLALGGLAATIRARLMLGSRRMVRATRAKAGRGRVRARRAP